MFTIEVMYITHLIEVKRVIQLDVFTTVTVRDVLCHFFNVLFVRTMFSVLIIHFLQSSLEYCEFFHLLEIISNDFKTATDYGKKKISVT